MTAGLTHPPDAELLAVAEEAARAAAAVLVEYAGRRGPGQISAKSSPTDLVSEADINAEHAIRRVLLERRPGDAVLGEEGDDKAGDTGLRWVVDPLDGTINYLFDLPQWCVSVACEGRVGVILDPVREELFRAVAGTSATLAGEPLVPSSCDDLGRALVATGFGYDSEVRRVQAAQVAELLPRVRDIRRFGSAALDLAWTAAGRFDAYYERGVQPWDVAAGLMLCTAVGLEAHPLPARDGLPEGVLVAPAAIAGELRELLA